MASEPSRESPAFPTQIRQMFDQIAPRYDLLNKLNSLGLDRYWRRVLVQTVAGTHPRQILDVATGTGDVAIALARACPEAQFTGMDLSREMMAVGVRKVEAAGLADRIGFGVGDALDIDLPDEAVDAVTCAFGVRNFASLEQGFREFSRVLTPGGRERADDCAHGAGRAGAVPLPYLLPRRLRALRSTQGVVPGNKKSCPPLGASV